MTTVATERARPPRRRQRDEPTIWGLTPPQIHDRLWAAFGVQVVRRHAPSEIVEGAELFLLCEPDTLVLFRPSQVLETLYWLDPELLVLRVRNARALPYRERAITENGRLVRFERVYREKGVRAARIALTSSPDVARAWQNAPRSGSPWRWLRAQVAPDRRAATSITARVFDASAPRQVMECLHEIMGIWAHPDSTIRRATRRLTRVWVDPSATVDDSVRCIGAVWVGAGRRLAGDEPVVGPAVLWDDPSARPEPDRLEWLEIEPTTMGGREVRTVRPGRVPGKRAFDVAFALVALTALLPLLPLIVLAIWLEDGGPFFFGHVRETVGGEEFRCWKFRSMRTDADEIKERLQKENQADGPQFFISDDPRITNVGAILRKFQIDELPQLWNVLLGQMSIVGPRPSPHSENQYCPAWREARLSVRPGLTGLWQVARTRRKGIDFQEWIRYDLEYVEQAGWALDLRIIARTIVVVWKGIV